MRPTILSKFGKNKEICNAFKLIKISKGGLRPPCWGHFMSVKITISEVKIFKIKLIFLHLLRSNRHLVKGGKFQIPAISSDKLFRRKTTISCSFNIHFHRSNMRYLYTLFIVAYYMRVGYQGNHFTLETSSMTLLPT